MTEGEPAVITAKFVAFKQLRTRGVVQLLFSVPAEQGNAALEAMGGLPDPAQSVYAALTRLVAPDRIGGKVTKAVFVEFKQLVSIVQLVFEVPHEHGNGALQALGGIPNRSNPASVVIARLDTYAATRMEEPPLEKSLDEQGKDAIKAAGTLCGKTTFQDWLVGEDGLVGMTPKQRETAATELLREQLQVKSRAELRTDVEALKRFRVLVAAYEAMHPRAVPAEA